MGNVNFVVDWEQEDIFIPHTMDSTRYEMLSRVAKVGHEVIASMRICPATSEVKVTALRLSTFEATGEADGSYPLGNSEGLVVGIDPN